MRIVIDLQGAQNGSRFRGIGRYSVSLAKALVKHRGSHEVVLLASGLFPDEIQSMRRVFAAELAVCELRVFGAIKPVSHLEKANEWRMRSSQLLREAYIDSLRPDVLIVSSLIEGAGDDVVTSVKEFGSVFTVAMLYDLIPLIFEDDYLADPAVAGWYHEKLKHLKNADAWFAISEASREDGIRHLRLSRERVRNISAAVGPEFRRLPTGMEYEGQLRDLRIVRPYLLYSGATDPRKNLSRLIDAYASLPAATRAEHQLVLAGGMPGDHLEALMARAQATGLGSHEIVFTDRVSDEQLVVLYSFCKAYVLPSLYEGFGLPALEAMSCGAAAIASNASSLPEVIEEPEALFDPRSTTDIAEKINRVLTDDEFRGYLIERGLRQARTFSWDRTAIAAWKMLDELNAQGHIARCEKFDPELCASALVEKIAAYGRLKPAEADLAGCSAVIARLVPRKDTRRRLYVDVSELYRRDSATGIQRVVRNISLCLLSSPMQRYKLEFVVATEETRYRAIAGFSSILLGEDRVVSESPEVIDARDGDIFLGLDFHDVIVTRHAGYFDHLSAVGVEVYFLVYDLLPITHAEYFSPQVTRNFESWLKVVSRHTGLICISKAAADEVKKWISRNERARSQSLEISWFHLGADFHEVSRGDSTASESSVLECLKFGPTFLCVGTLEPRKRQSQVLDALEILWAKGTTANLVFVGKEGWMVEEFTSRLIAHPKLGVNLFWLSGISDTYLEKIYAVSTCLIAASGGEGFGLPLVEAAQRRLPIIARDIAVFREVAGDHAFYFDGDEADDLAKAVETWLFLYAIGEHKDSGGMSTKPWADSAAELLDVLIGPRQVHFGPNFGATASGRVKAK